MGRNSRGWKAWVWAGYRHVGPYHLLTEEVLVTDVEISAALVAAASGECRLRKVGRVSFNGAARTRINDRQDQVSEVSSLKSMLGVRK